VVLIASLALWRTTQLGAARASATPSPSRAPTPVPCTFTLGFARLAMLIPDQVGSCVDNETHDPVSGNTIQHTTKGLLVWRKDDNLSAFTDGYRTWAEGPAGIDSRLNTEKFEWEK